MKDRSTGASPGSSGAAAAPQAAEPGELADFAQALIASRQNVSPKRLIAPGPDAAQLALLFEAAAAAPDHDAILPWRFVIVPQDKRSLLGEAFARALAERDPAATQEDFQAARDKAQRSPLLILAIARLATPGGDAIPDAERLISLGCAIQNILLLAHAMGYGAGLTSGQALKTKHVHALFRLAANEQPVCFINIGSVTKRKPLRLRPLPEAFVGEL